jgi:hypothetical protein
MGGRGGPSSSRCSIDSRWPSCRFAGHAYSRIHQLEPDRSDRRSHHERALAGEPRRPRASSAWRLAKTQNTGTEVKGISPINWAYPLFLGPGRTSASARRDWGSKARRESNSAKAPRVLRPRPGRPPAHARIGLGSALLVLAPLPRVGDRVGLTCSGRTFLGGNSTIELPAGRNVHPRQAVSRRALHRISRRSARGSAPA